MSPVVEQTPPASGLARKRLRLAKRLAGRSHARGAFSIVARSQGRPAPLSFAQEQLWLLDQADPGKATYNVPGSAYFSGPLRDDVFEATLDAIARRHSALRTTFHMGLTGPEQRVHATMPFALARLDLSMLPQGERDAEVRRLADEEARLPFDLETGPLFRGRLLKLAPEEHAFLLTFHHIVVDAWSMSIFTEELSQFYEALANGGTTAAEPLPIQYSDFAHWQRSSDGEQHLQIPLQYWKSALAGAPSLLELPTDRPRPLVPSYAGRRHGLDLPADLMRDVKSVGQSNGATLFVTLLAAFCALLGRYTGDDDIVVGSPSAGRNRAELAGLMGFFVNTLALRIDLSGDPSFDELVRRAKTVTAEAFAHQDAPFEKVIETVAPERSSATPLVTVAFALEESFDTWHDVAGLRMRPLPADTGTATFDLMLWCVKNADGGLAAAFEYRTDLFDLTTIEGFAAHFATLLKNIARDSTIALSRLDVFEAADCSRLFELGNATTPAPHRGELCIHERFGEMVERTSDAKAIVDGGVSLTYRECNDRANRIAAELASRGVRSGMRVGLCTARSSGAIVGMLGILKAGASYVPLDPEYPTERLRFMLADARIEVLCGDGVSLARLPPEGCEVVDLEAVLRGRHTQAKLEPNPASKPSDAAYVVYTSGSTGQPKGVVVPHRAVTNLVVDTDYVRIGPFDTIAQLAPLSFDAATFEIWGPLLNGARLVVAQASTVLEPAEFAAFLARENVTIVFLTTALFHAIARSQPRAFSGLETLLIGGEQLDPRAVRTIIDAGAPQRLFNIYGPTETTTFACAYRIEAVDENARRIPIGRSITGTRAYVLDAAQTPVPVGVPGELYIGGCGVADGYLGRPELTAQHFIADPFSNAAGARLYRTGDRVRLLPSGDLDILGRFDAQMKLRGFRVEPGEIEAVLRQDDLVEGAVVVAEGSSDARRLAAYVVARGAASAVTAAGLKRSLGARLPAYMIPSTVTLVAHLPLDANGKVDARALALAAPAATPRDTAELPASILQIQLIDLWQRMLGVAPIGIDDDFFALGGNSLMAARVMEQVQHLCGERIPLAELFGNATVSHLADAIIDRAARKASGPLTAVRRVGTKTPLFFLHGALAGDGFYCRTLAKSLGPEQPFFALAPHGVDGRDLPATIEAMADDYIGVIRTAQPHGPYRLGGFCNGGLVAYEMARRLTEGGERVDWLVLIDARPYGAGFEWLERALAASAFLNFDLWKRQRILAGGSRRIKAALNASRGVSGGWRGLSEALRSRTSLGEFMSEDGGVGVSTEWRMNVLSRAYVPRRYRGRIALLFSEEMRGLTRGDPSLGWRALCAGVELHSIPGDHLTSVSRYCEPVADAMKSVLADG